MLLGWEKFGAAAVALLWALSARGETPHKGCFDPRGLSAGEREQAETILLQALDGEALYTIVGGIKPMTNEVARRRFPHEATSAEGGKEFARFERIARYLSCPDWLDVGVRLEEQNGKSYLAFVFLHRPAIRYTLRRLPKVFDGSGLDPAAGAGKLDTLLDEDVSPIGTLRLGMLLGYPDRAAVFFAREQANYRLRGFLPRDFVRLPTVRHAGEFPVFVYAVRKGELDHPSNRSLAQRVGLVFDEYVKRRAAYPQKSPSEILLQWMREAPEAFQPPFPETCGPSLQHQARMSEG